MAIGLFEQLNWLTTRVKRLCCAVEQIQQSGAGLYRVYTALLSQTENLQPVVTVLENTIDPNLAWERVSPGNYLLKLPSYPASGPFTVGKTMVFVGGDCTNNSFSILQANNNVYDGLISDNGILLINYDTIFYPVDTFDNVSIEIRVYN